MNFIDKFLNNITMYRLVLYQLIVLVGAAILFSLFKILPYNPVTLILSTSFLLAVGWLTNRLFAYIFKSPTNLESVYISALILSLILTPTRSIDQIGFLGWAAVWMVASKYILAINKKHLFNPVAISLVIVGLGLNHAVNWWVGTLPMLPLVAIGGFLIVRKIKRWNLVLSFLITSVLTSSLDNLSNGIDLWQTLQRIIVDTPIIFFATIMLTEPLTTPPTKKLQIAYGAITGFLFSPQVHFGTINFTPELALVIGNGCSYLVSPKAKLILKLKQKIQIADNTWDFVFSPDRRLAFRPGQYMEWTLGYPKPDSRGNRRYFTIASSPTEDELRIGVKFNKSSSSFKKILLDIKAGSEIVASQLAGDFTIPDDPNQKLVFMAGGIGVTPFRSMIKYLVDSDQRRDIVLFYSNRRTEDIAYQDLFDKAAHKINLKTVYVLTDKDNAPAKWSGHKGYITEHLIREQAPDYLDRHFYLSGPSAMVETFKSLLTKMGVSESKIKTDFFPGF